MNLSFISFNSSNLTEYTLQSRYDVIMVTKESCLYYNEHLINENIMLRIAIFIFLVLYIIEHKKDLHRAYIWTRDKFKNIISK